MTTPSSQPHRPDGMGEPLRRDPVAAPLAMLLWVVVLVGLAYGVISTLDKVVQLFS
jgi:hypothetical protein